jgi:hypothetical protein
MITAETQWPKFSPEIYGRIALNDLVTFAVYFLSQAGGEINAEDIVAACFKLFPERFQLRGYPEWPDSTVVNKRWLDCRDKGYINEPNPKVKIIAQVCGEPSELAADFARLSEPVFEKIWDNPLDADYDAL